MSEVIQFRKLHSAQKNIVHNLPRFAVLRAGRRFGKTTMEEELAAVLAIRGQKVGWFSPGYKLNMPSYKRILKTVRPLVASASRIDGIIELQTGGIIEFWTLQDEDAGRSRAYHKVVIDEASLIKKGLRETWEQAISPTLLDYGGSAIMSGTPKGMDEENYFYQACTNKELGWVEFHAPTASNPMLDPVRVANLINEVPPLVYQQEYLAEFVDWSGSAFFVLDKMLHEGQPVPFPALCDSVFAVIDSAVKTGKEHDGTGVIFFAVSKIVGHPLILLDYDYVQIAGDLLISWMPNIYRRLDELAGLCGARYGSIGTFIEDKASGTILIAQAQRAGYLTQALPSTMTSIGKDERAISVSGYFHQGKVKISQYFHDKLVTYKGITKNHALTQICSYRVGQKDEEDDLTDCATYGAAIALGNSDGY